MEITPNQSANQIIEQPVKVSGTNGKTSLGSVTIQFFTKGQQLARTVARTAVCFAITVFTAFIPVVHLILAPLFLVLTVYIALKTIRVTRIISSGIVPCPNCGASVRILSRPYAFPFSDSCEGCRRPLEIQTQN